MQLDPLAPLAHFQETIRNAGDNDAARGAAIGVSRAQVQKLLQGDRTPQLLQWLVTQPELCAALLADALTNRPAQSWEAYDRIEAQLATVGEIVEAQADAIDITALVEYATDKEAHETAVALIARDRALLSKIAED